MTEEHLLPPPKYLTTYTEADRKAVIHVLARPRRRFRVTVTLNGRTLLADYADSGPEARALAREAVRMGLVLP